MDEIISPAIIGLIASIPRTQCLLERSIPSIAKQSLQLDHLVIISDLEPISQIDQTKIKNLLTIPVTFLTNQRTQGAAGSWNTGLYYIEQTFPQCYIAILDDDDTWDNNHINVCAQTAINNHCPEIILSKLRILKGEQFIQTQLPELLTPEVFLQGNPGWQGSNSFIKITALKQAGYFDESFQSTNDRDLAIRLLSLPNIRLVQTNQTTVTWYCNEREDALSAPGNPKKRSGLRKFYRKYIKPHGCKQIEKQFLDRCQNLFGFSQSDICHEIKSQNENLK